MILVVVKKKLLKKLMINLIHLKIGKIIWIHSKKLIQISDLILIK